jgi:hypothetical protein
MSASTTDTACVIAADAVLHLVRTIGETMNNPDLNGDPKVWGGQTYRPVSAHRIAAVRAIKVGEMLDAPPVDLQKAGSSGPWLTLRAAIQEANKALEAVPDTCCGLTRVCLCFRRLLARPQFQVVAGDPEREGAHHAVFMPVDAGLLKELEEGAKGLISTGEPHKSGSLAIVASIQPTQVANAERPTIWFHGEQQYSIDGKTPLKVTVESDHILQSFLESQVAMETSELEKKSGVTNVSRAMKFLAEWNGGIFEGAIRIPKAKAKGGYFISVQPL